jgi:nitric oxide reductase NorE protein
MKNEAPVPNGPHEAAEGQHPPYPGIWTFIAADCAGFAIFFLVFMAERMKAPALYDASARQLDVTAGLTNTLILISSSWLVALACGASLRRQFRWASILMLGGLGVGSCFAVSKISEYHQKLTAGITPATDDFFMFYFILTGIHLLHYLIGIGVLVIMTVSLRSAARDGGAVVPWLESGALYWHMVDLLWLFLFPMLYLLGGHA